MFVNGAGATYAPTTPVDARGVRERAFEQERVQLLESGRTGTSRDEYGVSLAAQCTMTSAKRLGIDRGPRTHLLRVGILFPSVVRGLACTGGSKKAVADVSSCTYQACRQHRRMPTKEDPPCSRAREPAPGRRPRTAGTLNVQSLVGVC